MKDIPTLNTLDEMVAQAVIYTDRRFQLRVSTDYVFDDPVAGQTWQDGRDAFTGKCPGYGKEGHKEWKELDDAYDELEPPKHPVKSYSLMSDYSEKFYLSPELGAQVEEVWTKKRARYGSGMELTGILTLAGLLKRLGRTDAATQIRDAEAARKEREARMRRNNLRANLSRKMDELEGWVDDYGAEIGVTVEMFQLPVELADCLKMEE